MSNLLNGLMLLGEEAIEGAAESVAQKMEAKAAAGTKRSLNAGNNNKGKRGRANAEGGAEAGGGAAAGGAAAAAPANISVWMGGSFSPPTRGHMNSGIEVAKALLHKHPGAHITVYYTPVHAKYSKPSVNEACIPVAERLKLVQLMIDELNRVKATDPELATVDFVLSTHETEAAEPVKTFDSAQQLAAKYGLNPATLYLAVGQDNIEGLLKGTWYMWKELLSTYPFVVFPRDDANLAPAAAEALKESLGARAAALGVAGLKDRLLMVDAKSQGISSTDLRRALRAANEAAIDANTFASIKDYIKAHGLYADEAACEAPKKGGGKRRTMRTKKMKRKNRWSRRRRY